MRLIEDFLNSLLGDECTSVSVSEMNQMIDEMCVHLNAGSMGEVLENQKFEEIYALFQGHLKSLECPGNMSMFWLSHVSMVEDLLNLL